MQPDDADWDAGDIRYNVLRWTSSPRAPFGGYGPSFVNPRTGQILGADIMLEYSFLTNRTNFDNIFSTAGLQTESQQIFADETQYCMLQNHLQASNMFGLTTAVVLGADDITKKELVKNLTGAPRNTQNAFLGALGGGKIAHFCLQSRKTSS